MGGSDITAPLAGDLVDERLVPTPPPPPPGEKYLRQRVVVNGQERDLQGSYLTKREGNARALILVSATATPDYSTVLTDKAKALAAREGLSQAEAQAALIELAQNAQFYKDMPDSPASRVYQAYQDGRSLTWSGNVVGKTSSQMGSAAGDMAKGTAQGVFVDTPKGIYYMVTHPLETLQGLWNTATNPGKAINNAATSLNESAEKGEAGYTIGRMWGGLIGGKGVGMGTKAVARRAATALGLGEPVSVANGEYLETWRDFFIPGTFAFDGARYMGLKLELPAGYQSPLGACQISMFDEVFSNPSRGQLLFHDRDGRRIPFRRPFNFLPSVNAGYPNLELKAPWLKQLTLKDGPVTRHFRQYRDNVYRLEKIADLNGFELTLLRNEEGHLERLEGPDGLKLVFENDRQGRRLSITLIGTDDSAQALAQYGYDRKGRMQTADCQFGMSVRYAWHADDDLLSFWHNLTRQSETRFTYDDRGRVVHTATNGLWNGDRFEYQDGETRYLPAGSVPSAQRYQYDEHDNITAEIDALGGTVAHGYDGHGFRVATTDANGNTVRTKYDSHGNIGEQVDAEGRATTFIWGDDGELHLVIDGAGNRTTYEHDTRSNVIAETDAEGHTVRLSRDEMGRVLATEFADGTVERRTWDGFNRLVSVTDADGSTTTFAYDAFNRPVETTDPLGHVTRRSYHAGPGGFATPSHVTRPDGVTVSSGFDGQGKLASVADGEGRTWTYRNGAFSILESITDPNGGVTSFGYDSEGRILSVTNPVGSTYHYGRDLAGRVVEEEDFDGRLTRYVRDAAGRMIETIKPDGARLVCGYDKSGLIRRIESFDAEGEAEDLARFWYDGRGLLIRAENKATLVEYERDRNGRVIGETLNGKRIKSKRDAMGRRVLREITGLGGGIVDYVRDPMGAVAKMVAGETEITFRRDALGQETRREIGGFGLAQRYDEAGQLAAQSAGPKNPVDFGMSRLGWNVPSGEGMSKRSRTVARVYEYDRAFAPVRIDDSLWGEIRFDYDDNGQMLQAAGARGTERFSYDPARNLVGASSSAPFSGESAGYGPAFDAAFGTVTPSATPSAWQRTPGGVVQIARGPNGERVQLLHDACGRLIERRVERDGFRPQKWRYRWDVQDRLVAVTREDGEQWLFRYDPFGRRVSKVRRFAEAERERAARLWPSYVAGDGAPEPGRASTERLADNDDTAPDTVRLPLVGTAYLWEGAHMIAEAPLRLDGHVAWDEAIRWHFEGGESSDDAASHLLIAKELPAGATLPDGTVLDRPALFPIVCDQIGMPKEMFDTRGDLVWAADHHVWGEVRAVRTFGALAAKPSLGEMSDALACPWRFPGQYEDAETGLFYNRHRHYDPLTGQYASPDPLGLAGGERPQAYVENPSVWIDSLGLKALTAGQRHYLYGGVGGRWGTAATRLQNFNIARSYEKKGYQLQGGGFGPEEYIPPPPAVAVKGSTKGGTYVDITARKNGQTIRIQTVDTLADGVTPTPREAAAAARIRNAFPNDKLLLIPKAP